MVATAGQFLNKSGSSWNMREGRGARCVHLRTKMASLSVTDLKGAVLAAGGGSRGGPGLRPFSLCVGFCSEGKLNLKCTF